MINSMCTATCVAVPVICRNWYICLNLCTVHSGHSVHIWSILCWITCVSCDEELSSHMYKLSMYGATQAVCMSPSVGWITNEKLDLFFFFILLLPSSIVTFNLFLLSHLRPHLYPLLPLFLPSPLLLSLLPLSYEEALQTLADSEAKKETVDKELRLVSSKFKSLLTILNIQ